MHSTLLRVTWRHSSGLQLQLRNLLEDTAQSTATASDQAAEFGKSLQGHAKVLAAPQDPAKIREIVADMLAGTQKMEHVTSDLSTKLQARTSEVNALTESLRRAQSEALLDSLTGLKNRRGPGNARLRISFATHRVCLARRCYWLTSIISRL